MPNFKVHPETCIYQDSVHLAKHTCSTNREYILSQENVYQEELVNLSIKYNLEYYKLTDPFCSKSQCSMFLGETIMYRDSNHLNIQGSILIGNYLRNLMTK